MAAGKSRRQVRPRGRRSRGPESSLRSEGSTSRLQALTDGFFAVTMTLRSAAGWAWWTSSVPTGA